MVERIGGGSRYHVTGIEAEHVHAEARAHGEVFAPTLRLTLVVITAAQNELVVVSIFQTYAPLYLLQLFFESAGSIAETFEDSRDGRDIIKVLLTIG